MTNVGFLFPFQLVADDLAIPASCTDTGFRGPLNYYRSIQPGFDLTAAFKGRVVEQPSFFPAGEEDGIKDVGGGFNVSESTVPSRRSD